MPALVSVPAGFSSQSNCWGVGRRRWGPEVGGGAVGTHLSEPWPWVGWFYARRRTACQSSAEGDNEFKKKLIKKTHTKKTGVVFGVVHKRASKHWHAGKNLFMHAMKNKQWHQPWNMGGEQRDGCSVQWRLRKCNDSTMMRRECDFHFIDAASVIEFLPDEVKSLLLSFF